LEIFIQNVKNIKGKVIKIYDTWYLVVEEEATTDIYR
jgi:hypothetical protein